MTVNIVGLGKITASKEVLNLISIMASNSQETNIRNGYKALAERDRKCGIDIYNKLDAVKFYNN